MVVLRRLAKLTAGDEENSMCVGFGVGVSVGVTLSMYILFTTFRVYT